MPSKLQLVDEQDRPTKPSLTPALRSLLDKASEPRFTRNGPMDYVISDRWASHPLGEPIPRISADGKKQVTTALAQYRDYMKPALRGKISARVTVLLSHYFVPDLPIAAQTALLTDWVDALADFPWWAIQQACGEWLQSEPRRPTPADIVLRCKAAESKVRVDVWALKLLLKVNADEGPAQRTHSHPDPVRVPPDE